jgi:hypothetical protein
MFEVGQRVVCVNDYWTSIAGLRGEILPKKGVIYTVRTTVQCPRGCHQAIRLVEIINPAMTYGYLTEECQFDAASFRPIVESKIDVFREILEKTPSK